MAREAGPIRVLLVSFSALVRVAVRHALAAPDVEIVGDVETPEDGLPLALSLRPDIVLLDLDLAQQGGLELIRELVPRQPRTRVVVLSNVTADRDVAKAMRSGAAGYLTKDLTPEALLRSIRGAQEGDLPMPRRLAAALVARLVQSAGPPGAGDGEGLARLSRREAEVLRLISEGLTDRAVAESLGISTRTVETHVSNMLRKLGAPTRLDAARLYRESA
jgi:DNA-binding NarL/FixJ family response regulator